MDQTARAGGQEQELILRARIIAIAAAALIGAAAFALADEPGEPDKGCDGGTPEMVECFKAKTAFWDKRLNIAYAKALQDAQPKQREQLRVAQRLWLQYRDANCLYYDLGEGSIARIEADDCMCRLTRSRAQELEGTAERN